MLVRKVTSWIIIITLISALAGSASALFLWLLDLSTQYREQHYNLIWFLPIAGLVMGLLYQKYGDRVELGNKLIYNEFKNPQEKIPFRMAPMVFISTLLSHLVGASVGREGTAVQMSASIADQFTNLFKLSQRDRKMLLVIGISAGFASVFGTPLAASIFAIEVFHDRKYEYKFIIHSLLAAYIAHYVCLAWGIHHSTYSIAIVPALNLMNIFWSVIAGIVFGLIAYLYSQTFHVFSSISNKIKITALRPFIAGLVIIIFYYFFDLRKFMGLGLPSISSSFVEQMNSYDFLIKLLLTSFTIAFGFKGGEVTPLFFIGATFGNVLIWFIPLPMSLLAGMGFAAVFAGATNTPLACILMGAELFGLESIFYIAIACVVAFLFSGKKL
jgi:H+/Cl- antiporter ClcA